MQYMSLRLADSFLVCYLVSMTQPLCYSKQLAKFGDCCGQRNDMSTIGNCMREINPKELYGREGGGEGGGREGGGGEGGGGRGGGVGGGGGGREGEGGEGGGEGGGVGGRGGGRRERGRRRGGGGVRERIGFLGT